MKFYDLSSIVAAHKEPVSLLTPTESFGVAPGRLEAYIEPTFDKAEFEQEKPAVILVSAVGATGKTTLARVLSNRTGLPLMDLANHKPVGDNTLTGLLTSTFRVEDLTSVFQRIRQGTFGVIIDGIDEGRSKTTEKAFEAFLDDIARLCKTASSTSFVLLGRTQVLEHCWLYLTDQGVPTGLVTINPFDIEQARKYIDEFTGGPDSTHAVEYREVRDMIVEKLGAAFTDGGPDGGQSFLSFIGYPPVLDAIVTLLQQEKNYHRLSGELRDASADGVEVQLLYRIATYILEREKRDKVLPNILLELIKDVPPTRQREIIDSVYEPQEQCTRLASYCLGRNLELRPIGEAAIDNEYEDRLRPFLPEHPFIAGGRRQFRNAVFEAVALANLVLSSNPDAVQLALDYVDSHKHNYHLLYLLHRMAQGREVPSNTLRVLIGSALEFQSRKASASITIGDPGTGEWDAGQGQSVPIEIEIAMGTDEAKSKRFMFQSNVSSTAVVNLGNKLSSALVILPCQVSISGTQELELTAPTIVFADRIALQAPALVLRVSSADPEDRQVLLVAETLESTVDRIIPNGTDFVVAVGDRNGIAYPAIQYVRDKVPFPHDALLKEKYLRLRRILVHFRSHSRGALAKYRAKIDHERVLRNPMGEAILQRLLRDGILTCDGNFYFLQPEKVDIHLGVSWIDLRKGGTSERLEQYLRAIN